VLVLVLVLVLHNLVMLVGGVWQPPLLLVMVVQLMQRLLRDRGLLLSLGGLCSGRPCREVLL